METWAIAILCVALAFIGALLGGSTVYVISRQRHRKCCAHDTASFNITNVADEEFHTQMTDAEKSVLQGILRKNGALCLSLRLPESTLSVPMPTVIHSEDTHIAPLHSVSVPSTPQSEIIELNADPRHACASSGEQDRADIVTQSPRSAASGLGVIMPEGPAESTVPITPVDSTRRSIISTATVVTKTRKVTPASVVFHSSVSWSSPVDDKNRRSIIRAVPETMGNIVPVPLQVSMLSGIGQKAPYQQSLRSAPISIADSNFESISSVNTPITPHILSSPCDSIDYVVVPPSPSISSMYGMSISGTLSRPPSIMSPRSVNMGKSSSSPGGLTGSSLFTPPAVLNKRHFESQLSNQ
ncbi:hypothetical protein LPJ77_001826 [Coemansia sp. RSA 2523]|nr:hypothetical protein LPJ58_004228 [Coemansia sp. RSA 1591]KAJ1758143.1 hypothetical protein LPJ69_004175 [Coemansia sp. RSA 1752]KAJ1778995.1 hypothetical protein LPJ54_001278 [Coemansia sp. RSA 1824]KAJ1785022.1 hypothetical protein LPJ67_004107 [Coemansia sp. RSA 1938]KAJ1791002.1 hypothetical protein LPJ62_001647 [Coemansia sp. RSA 2167]KAJ1809190.1 hypothetical protein LPJ77_001826 [Coemansia sp. RSA 2523]KAJ2154492.1 hypothetical protein J3F82_001129 [Coemansia sp. RSA 637]KAJ2228966